MKALAISCLLMLVTATGRPAAAGNDDARWQAHTHYKSGQRLYDAGAYQSAALEFTAAYDLSSRPELLFNMGQAYRLAGDCELARDAYQRFRAEDPTAIERTNVSERIAEMERCIADRTPPPAPLPTPAPRAVLDTIPAEVVAQSPALPPRPRHPPADDRRGRRWTGGALAGGGAALVGTGVYFWMRAGNHADELSDDFAGGGEWSDEASRREDAITSDRRLAIVLGGVGGLSMAAGAYLLWSGRQRARTRQLVLIPTAGGAEVTWSWCF